MNFNFIDGKRYFDGAFFGGGGLKLSFTARWGFSAVVDYHFTTGDDLDWVPGGKKDGYLPGRLALVRQLAF